ncbi:hypothetical protein BDM02DRAFT_3117038 [Thelephora ganbajun]|uniref:Uncharacterized protein n=1 Tax=Thelephora ganbajun TaxID=370292 RepID=A0ACB6ZCU5_THEGA|nr:hypothetical protein BDM02DRAFT_3117038 [Thelephora ganbajun]
MASGVGDDASHRPLSFASGVHTYPWLLRFLECQTPGMRYRLRWAVGVLWPARNRSDADVPSATSLCDLRKWFVRAVGILTLGSMAILSL